MKTLYDTALQLLFTSYRWGGDDFSGWDCSGLVQELLLSAGGHPSPGADMTANDLYEFFSKKENHTISGQPTLGALVFYKEPSPRPPKIVHVAMCIDPLRMIEAGGGGSSTISRDAAIAQNAYVRIRPIRQKNLAGIFMPDYSAVEL